VSKKISTLTKKPLAEILAMGLPAYIPIGINDRKTIKISLQDLIDNYKKPANR